MKKYIHLAGLFIIIIGTLALILTRVAPLTAHNTLLLTGLLLIVAGIIIHIQIIKHDSRY